MKIETIEYNEPTTWDDKNLDWDNAHACQVDYMIALRCALMERYAAKHRSFNNDSVFDVAPGRTVLENNIESFVDCVRFLCPSFVNLEYDYKDDYSDFPKMWTYADLANSEGCEIVKYPFAGDLCSNVSAWLKAMRTAINKLTCIKASKVYATRYLRSGVVGDPPFEESINGALDKALNQSSGLTTRSVTTTIGWENIYAWSGNSHWKCPDPEDGDDEDNVDGYRGAAKSRAFGITRLDNWVYGSELDFKTYILATAPTGAVEGSTVLATSTFDGGKMGLKEGMNYFTTHVSDPSVTKIQIGDFTSIPKNTTVPVSDFNEYYNVSVGRSAKRGYEAKIFYLVDYNCENGFKFRPEEKEEKTE